MSWAKLDLKRHAHTKKIDVEAQSNKILLGFAEQPAATFLITTVIRHYVGPGPCK